MAKHKVHYYSPRATGEGRTGCWRPLASAHRTTTMWPQITCRGCLKEVWWFKRVWAIIDAGTKPGAQVVVVLPASAAVLS